MKTTAAKKSETFSRPAHEQRARDAGLRVIRQRIRLPPKLTLSEWADRHRVLSNESSAEPGPWRTERVPYLREIMDTISGREYHDITILKSSQTGGTEVLNNAVGYYIDQEPSPILVIQPNVKPMAEAYSKDRLAPMLRDSPRLRGKVRDPRSRDSGNTVLHKTFPGGYITVIGANSPAGLASRPIRVVLADELDRWGASAGTEGDPLSLAEARMITYRHRRKCVKVTTLGNEGESRGEKEWAASDQRFYYVPCPHCEEFQPLQWRDTGEKPDIRSGKGRFFLVWEKAQEGDTTVHKPETAAYQCRKCNQLIYEHHKAAMVARGKWVKHNPESRRAGFYIGGLLSLWVRWVDIARNWLKKKDDPEQRKTFFNTELGLLYQQDGEQPDATELQRRALPYPAEVPAGVGALTMAIDVQGDRLECDVRGWGDREESWHIRLERLYGDPERDEAEDVWHQAESLLNKVWTREDGKTMRIRSCMVDSGYLTDRVYRWVRPRQIRRIFAYKGVDGAKEPIARASRANKDGVKTFTVNPVKMKDILFARLKRVAPGAGYLHFGTRDQTGADTEYFHQFGSEKRVVEFVKNVPVVKYTRLAGRRNEAIDLYVMNLAALRSLGMQFAQRLGKRAAQPEALEAEATVETEVEPATPDEESPPPRPAQKPSKSPFRRPGGWMRGMR